MQKSFGWSTTIIYMSGLGAFTFSEWAFGLMIRILTHALRVFDFGLVLAWRIDQSIYLRIPSYAHIENVTFIPKKACIYYTNIAPRGIQAKILLQLHPTQYLVDPEFIPKTNKNTERSAKQETSLNKGICPRGINGPSSTDKFKRIHIKHIRIKINYNLTH